MHSRSAALAMIGAVLGAAVRLAAAQGYSVYEVASAPAAAESQPATAASRPAFVSQTWDVQEEDLGPWNRRQYDSTPQTLGELSPDRRHRAYVASREGKESVVLDDTPGPAFDLCGQPVFSPDSRRLAYGARGKEGWAIIVDGQAGKSYQEVGQPVFSPDGKRLAHIAGRGEKQCVVVDGKEGPEFAEIDPDSLGFSPDGQRVAYAARGGGGSVVVVDGKAEKAYDAVGRPVFSPDGNRVAYKAYIGRGKARQLSVIDGQAGPEGDAVDAGPVFSADGKHAAYALRKGDRCAVHVDGAPGSEYAAVNGLAYAGDGKLAVCVSEGGKEYVVLDGKSGEAFEEVLPSSLRVLPDGLRLFYLARRGREWGVILEGQLGPPCRAIVGEVLISPDGKRMAYVAKGPKGDYDFFVVIDGKPAAVGHCVIEPESLAFSPDSGHVVYVARPDGKWSRVVIDGEAGPAYGVITKQPVFNADGSMQYEAARDGRLYRVYVTAKRK